MRVCRHGCDLKMFCFSRANHASTNLKKFWSWKLHKCTVIYPLPRRLKPRKSLQTCCVNFFRLSWHFKRKKSIFRKALPACRRLLFPLLHAEKVPFPRATKEIGDVCTQAKESIFFAKQELITRARFADWWQVYLKFAIRTLNLSLISCLCLSFS